MLKIGFIHPSNKYNYDRFRNPPLVELYLLTIIERHFQEKVGLSLIDLRGIEDKYIFYHIPEKDVYLYSISTPDFPEFYNILTNLRSLYPSAKHIAGGPHINIFPERCNTLFDAIVLGEGEESIIKVIGDILNLRLKPVYRQEQYIDLNLYPYPDRKYLPKTTIVGTGILPGENYNLLGTEAVFSRGCPGNCYFCANKKLTFGPVRFRSPELVTEEIEYLKREYGIKALMIRDDHAIPSNHNDAIRHLEAIRKISIKWRGLVRANSILDKNMDIVELLKESGCIGLGIGIESVSPRVLKLVNKGINLDRTIKFIKLLGDIGIGIRLNLIMGLPGEPDDIVKQTLKFIDETNPVSVMLSILCPMPGSEMFDNPDKFGIVIDTTDWEKYHVIFGRFDPSELPKMVFHYKDDCPWGKGNNREKILQNYIELQTNLRDRKLIF